MFCCFRNGSDVKLEKCGKVSSNLDPLLASSKISGHIDREHKQDSRRSWLVVTSSADLTLQQVNCRAAASRYSLTERDVQQTDPQEGYRSPIRLAVRGKAILVCLEGLRVIVTPAEALLLSVPGQQGLLHFTTPFSNNPFVRDLLSRLRISTYSESDQDFVDKSLPFELLVLEWALSTAVKALTEEILSFEQAATPVLEALAKKVSHKNIHRLRQVKFGASDLLMRLDYFKQALINLLDSDLDLLRLHLSRSSRLLATSQGRTPRDSERRPRRSRSKSKRSERLGRRKQQLARGGLDVAPDDPMLLECRSLIECYLIQLEGGWNTLRGVSDCSGDTQDMVHLAMKLNRIKLGPV